MSDEVDELYALPLPDFMEARKAAVAKAKAAGDKAKAAELGKAHKPTLTAWAVNQVVRRNAPGLAELLAAGDAARRAHRRVMAGHEVADLRDVDARERELRDALVQRARTLCADAGHDLGLDQIAKIRDTFHAAALGSEAARSQVQAARLIADIPPPSLEDLMAAAAEPPEPVAPEVAAAESAAAAKRREEKERERAAAEAAKQRAAAEAKLRELERNAAEAVRVAEKAEAEAAKLRAAAEALLDAAADARVELRKLSGGR